MDWLFKAIASYKSTWLLQVDLFLKILVRVFYLFDARFR